MSLLIDGHNMIGVLPGINLSDPDDEWQLVQRLRSYAAARSRPLTVVFDSGEGPPPQWKLSSKGVRVRFSPPGKEADEVILQIVRRSRQPGQISVVTNDRRLADLLRAAGAQVRSASQFAGQLIAPATVPSTKETREPQFDPHDPAFADIYAGFVEAEKDAVRFGAELHADEAVWIERLYGDDRRQVERAARWLGRFGGAAALEPLLDARTHSAGQVRAAALLALADLADPVAADVIADRLAADESSMAREAAAQALARLGGSVAEAALEAALNDSRRKVRKAAAAGLKQVRARR